MDVGPPLVAHLKAAEAVEPGEGALHHPAIPSESLARFDAASGDAGEDTACPQGMAAPREVVGLVGVTLAFALTMGARMRPLRPALG
jgi:hypothetical protein